MPGPNLHPMSLQKFGEILTPKVKVMPPAIGWNTYPPENWHKTWNRPMGFLVKSHQKWADLLYIMAMLVDQSVTCLFSIDITELGREPRTSWKQHYLNQLFCLTLRIHPSRFTFLFGYCILFKKGYLWHSHPLILSSQHPPIDRNSKKHPTLFPDPPDLPWQCPTKTSKVKRWSCGGFCGLPNSQLSQLPRYIMVSISLGF